MKNNDYKVEFEEHRREIGLDRNEDAILQTRAERHERRRKQKKTSRYTTINLILGIFTFIPILIFVYVIYNFYFGSDSGSAKVDNEFPVEYGTNSSPGNSESPGSVVIDSEKEKEDEEQSTGNADKGTAEDSKAGSKKPPVIVNPPAVEKKETENKTETPKVEEKPETENKTEDNTKERTHIVATNETLYRISMNYYGSDAGIDKIKKANGLSSNEIMAGQKLIIP